MTEDNLIRGVKEMLKQHYDLRPSSIVRRFKFYNRVHDACESFSVYVAALREIVDYHEYKLDQLQ